MIRNMIKKWKWVDQLVVFIRIPLGMSMMIILQINLYYIMIIELVMVCFIITITVTMVVTMRMVMIIIVVNGLLCWINSDLYQNEIGGVLLLILICSLR